MMGYPCCGAQCDRVMAFPIQDRPSDEHIDEGVRASVIEDLVPRISAGYVIPETAEVAATALRAAQASGAYAAFATARAFAESVTADLRAATHDRHIAGF